MAKTHKFVAEEKTFIKGFWRPEKGDSIEGVLVERAEGPMSEYLVLRLTKPAKVVSRDRDTGDEIERTIPEEMHVGVSYWASLRGLERYAGHWVKITVLGKKKETGDGGQVFHRWDVDVDVSNEPVDPKLASQPPEPKSNSKRSRKPAPAEEQDDLPF
jgi:hypothetical protein